MCRRIRIQLWAVCLCAALGCGGGGDGGGGESAGSGAGASGSGSASVTIEGTTYAVSDVVLELEPGEGGYYSIEGRDAAHPDQDCLEGLSGGMGLYGDVPVQVSSLADLPGQRLAIEFSGDVTGQLVAAGLLGVAGWRRRRG